MRPLKTFKILIDKATSVEAQDLDLRSALIEIKERSGRIIKTMPLSQIAQFSAAVEAHDRIILLLTLLEGNSLGARQPRPLADGSLDVSCADVEKEHFFAVGCPLRNIITRRTILSLAVVVQQDLEKVNYNVPDSQPSYIEQQSEPQQSEVEPPTQPPKQQASPSKSSSLQVPIEEDPQAFKKKPSPIKRISKRPVRARHFQYSVKNEQFNFQLNNKVSDQLSNSIQNLRMQFDQAISSICFYGKASSQLIAQVLFKTNPTEQELKHLRIKVPQSEQIVDILVQTLEGGKFKASTSLPHLDQSQCLKVNCSFSDESSSEVKGKMKFNYKETQEELEKVAEIPADKLQMSTEINVFDKSKTKQHLQFLPFLFPENKPKPSETPRLKLPKIYQKEPNLVSQTINEKIAATSPEPLSSRSKKTQYLTGSELDQMQEEKPLMAENQVRIRRSKTIQSRNYSKFELSLNEERRSIVKVVGVSIKFYKFYAEKISGTREGESFVGKSLLIYANPNSVYLSEPTYQSKNLNWNLRNCEIEMSSFDNLTFELSLQKQKSVVGELVVSYNQLKFNQEENSLYFGYLTRRQDVVAKICVDFRLTDSEATRMRNRASTLDRTERRPRNRRLFSEQLTLPEDNTMENSSPSKVSLYHSVGVPSTIPEVTRKRKLLKNYEEAETDVLRDKRKSRALSPERKYM